MGWKPKHCPSFLKFLLHPDFADNLPIPPLFVKKHLDGAGLENPILATCESGKTWAVTIVRMDGNGRYCFKQGWPEFVKDNCLEAGDFLLFWLLGDSTFLVSIYSPSGIEKSGSTTAVNRPTNFSNTTRQHHHQVVLQIDSASETSGGGGQDKDGKEEEERCDVHQTPASVNTSYTPSFEKLINNSSNYWMRLPIAFVREAKILGSMRSIVLTDAEGMEWPVKLIQRECFRGFYLTEGWSTFRKANNIQNGDTCLFLFLRKEGNMIQVMVLIQKGTRRTGRGRNEGKYKGRKVVEETDGIIETASSVKHLHAPWFVRTLSRSCYYRMGLPIWFARETRLTSRKFTVLKDAAGSEFRVSIKQRSNTFGYDLTTGWSRFRQENTIDKGDTCLFQFFHGKGNFIHVNVLKRKARSRFVRPGVRRGRWRPRLQ